MRTDRFQEERRSRILTLLQERQRLPVLQLARHFKVTGATIRSDLTALMKQNKVIRTLGSAMIVNQGPIFPLAGRLKIQAAEKRAIGKLAATLVSPRDVIALDASSTCLAMAPFLRSMEGLTLMTNCLAVVNEFVNCKNIQIIMPCGRLQHETASLVGQEAVDFLKNIRIKTAFVGADSISLDTGLCDTDAANMEFKRALIGISKKVVAMVDSSKWNVVSLSPFATMDQVQVVVTDEGILPKAVRALNRKGVRTLIAKMPHERIFA